MARFVNALNSWSRPCLSFFIFLCIVTVVACKQGEDDAPTPEGGQTGKYPSPIMLDAACLLTKIDFGAGIYSTMEYDTDKKLTAYYTHIPADAFMAEQNGTFTLTRDNDGSVIKIQAVGDNGSGSEIIIDYNESGNWIKTKITNKSSPAYITVVPVYNKEGFIEKITKENVDVNNPYTTVIEYAYENGNVSTITNYVNNKPVISKLEYDLTRESKWSEYDLLSVYQGAGKPLHKNVLKRVVTSSSIAGSSTVNDLAYQFNDKGYPVQASSQSVFNGVTKTSVTTKTYKCD